MRKDCHCSLFLAAALSTTVATASETVESSGRDNHAIISQAVASRHQLHLRQDGSFNLAEIIQRGRDNRSFVEQSQLLIGTADVFERLQLVRVSQLGIGGDIHLQQAGGNDALVLQAAGSLDASAHLLQVGLSNALGVTQAGARQLAGIFQIGDGNKASLSQAHPGDGVGSPETMRFPEPGLAALFANDFSEANSASLIVQEGDEQEARSLQSGSSSSSIIYQVDGATQFASVWQDGDSVSFLYQAGADNFAAVTQYGDGHSSSIQQNGSFNQARIVQGSEDMASGSAANRQRNDR